MQYRLRTLLLLTAIGPPALAATWFALPYLPIAAMILILLAWFLTVPAVAAFAVAIGLGWGFSSLARALIHFGRHPENRE
jgi:hypothetical protein